MTVIASSGAVSAATYYSCMVGMGVGVAVETAFDQSSEDAWYKATVQCARSTAVLTDGLSSVVRSMPPIFSRPVSRTLSKFSGLGSVPPQVCNSSQDVSRRIVIMGPPSVLCVDAYDPLHWRCV